MKLTLRDKSNPEELRFIAWDDYVKDKPILKDMMAEMARSIMYLKKNQDAMHERQEKMWVDITMLIEKVMVK